MGVAWWWCERGRWAARVDCERWLGCVVTTIEAASGSKWLVSMCFR